MCHGPCINPVNILYTLFKPQFKIENIKKMFIFVFACIGVQHKLCCVFLLFFFILCTLCYLFLWVVYLWLPLRYSLTFISCWNQCIHHRSIWTLNRIFGVLLFTLSVNSLLNSRLYQLELYMWERGKYDIRLVNSMFYEYV